jgi:hypothetical protein
MSKHTPGPWFIKTEGKTIGIGVQSLSGIARINPFGNENEGEPIETDMANAKLIAAAPDMLEALKLAETRLNELEKHFGKQGHSSSDTIKQIKAAIAKATEGK